MAVHALRTIYQLKIELEGSNPAIWRRVLVESSMSLDKLHICLQVTMGWFNAHLHQFVKDTVCYSEIDDESPDHILDQSNFRIGQLLKQENDQLHYVYDFGDAWEHNVTLEKILPYEDNQQQLPNCLDGQCCCPPEDVGGIPGYENFLSIISSKNHPQYKEMLKWQGGKFEPELFDHHVVNELLKKYVIEEAS